MKNWPSCSAFSTKTKLGHASSGEGSASAFSDIGSRVALPDGRLLGYSEFGASGGRPLFYFHGFAGSRLEAQIADSAARLCGLRLIAVDRPGYGLSTPCAASALLQWPRDVQALADHLGVASYSILGVSGGAPYALACAALVPERIRRIALVCPLGPANCPDLPRPWRVLHKATLLFGPGLEWAGRLVGALLAVGVQLGPERVVSLASRVASLEDRKVLCDAAFRRVIGRSLCEAFRQGGKGLAGDLRLYLSDWGRSLDEVQAPVVLWHGEGDRIVPVAMGRCLATRIPDCRATFFAEEGHFSLPVRKLGDILAEF